MDGGDVLLQVYEVTKGLARTLSPTILGKQINGVWHTGIMVYNKEFFFSSMGIQSFEAGKFFLKPDNVVSLGHTEIPYEVFMEHLEELGATTFRPTCYNLLEHNCNTFSNEIANFLTGQSIPAEITDLPQEVMETPFGAFLKPFLDAISSTGSLFTDTESNVDMDRASKCVAREQDTNRLQVDMTSKCKTSAEKVSFEPQTDLSTTIPSAMVYVEKSVLTTYPDQRDVLRGLLQPNEFQSFEEIFEYLFLPEVNWSLCNVHLRLLCHLVTNAGMDVKVRSLSANLLQLALSYSEFLDVCTHDSKESLRDLIKHVDVLPCDLLLIIAKSLCNFLSERRCVEWLLNNDKEKSKSIFALCCHCLLSENMDLVEVGCSLSGNILRNTKMPEDIAFQVGVAMIEVICFKAYPDQSENFFWFSLCECIKINKDLVDFAKTMGFDLRLEEEKHPSIEKHTKTIRHMFV